MSPGRETDRTRPRPGKAILTAPNRHYGFTDEELDFVINTDIKCRMGLSADQAGRDGGDAEEE